MTKKTVAKKDSKTPENKRITKEKALFLIAIVVWVTLSIIVSQFIVAYPLSWILGTEAAKPFWTLIYYILYYALALFLIFYVPPRLVMLYQRHRSPIPKSLESFEDDLRTTPSSLGIKKSPTFVDIGLAPIGYVIYIIIASVITNLLSLLPWFDANEAQNVGFNGYFITTGERICAILAIVFVAPIAEELIMRGWLYGKMRQKLGVVLSIIIVSSTFAVLHGQLNVGVSVFVLSVVLCGLREITGTIWSSMILHILSNGIAFYVLYNLMI